jgi:hypothetical protein
MAWLFAIGSSCFALGSLPLYFNAVPAMVTAVTFFVGSLFFTSAGYLQYYLAINAGRSDRVRFSTEMSDPDVRSAAIQSIGTLFFNISTFGGLVGSLTTEEANHLIWAPDVFGSIAFLVSSWIAVKVVRSRVSLGHDTDWWIATLNLLGSIAFGVAAVAAVFLPTTGQPLNISIVNAGTFLGACGFLMASLLVLRTESESVTT